MGEDPNAIRQQIEQTRERMGDTVEALSYKADVPSRAKDSINERVGAVKSKISGVGSQVSDAAPDPADVKQGARQAVGVVQENPLGLVVGAAAAGFLAGMLIPSTRVEDERIGPIADQVREEAKHTGQEALEHGKQIAQETAQAATESVKEAAQEVRQTAQEAAQQHGDQMSTRVQDAAEQVQRAGKQ
jgi:gas vesicle protein